MKLANPTKVHNSQRKISFQFSSYLTSCLAESTSYLRTILLKAYIMVVSLRHKCFKLELPLFSYALKKFPELKI